MNILFLSLLDVESVEEHNIYTDLLREFRKNGHKLYVVSPIERRKKRETFLIEEEDCKILKLKIGNIQKTNYIEKGISLLNLQRRYKRGILRDFAGVSFDLILYATPPVTLQKVVKYIKKRDGAVTYLLLKDIWPQGVADLGVISTKSVLYRYFRKKEKGMYAVSDYIGCMSENNVSYLLANNPELNADRVEVCPNSIELLSPKELSENERNTIKKEKGIPLNKLIFLYGGNLGRPQGLDFLLRIIEKCEDYNCFFLIIGDGTEYLRVKSVIDKMDEKKVKIIKYLPKEEYEQIVRISDVGLIFLDACFTVPNIPSRMLSYMQASLPLLAATDVSTDLKQIIEDAGMGCWCKNGDEKTFFEHMSRLKNNAVRKEMGKKARYCLEKNYTVQVSYNTIIRHMPESYL